MVSFIGGGNRSTRRKPHTCCKSLTNVITQCCIEYTSPWTGSDLTTLMVIATDCTGSCNSTMIQTGYLAIMLLCNTFTKHMYNKMKWQSCVPSVDLVTNGNTCMQLYRSINWLSFKYRIDPEIVNPMVQTRGWLERVLLTLSVYHFMTIYIQIDCR
jgi:hypothetical protein